MARGVVTGDGGRTDLSASHREAAPGPLLLARPFQTGAIAMTLTLAFTRRPPMEKPGTRHRLLVALAFPGYLLIAILGVAAHHFYFRQGVVLSLERKRAGTWIPRIRRAAIVAAVGGIFIVVSVSATIVAGLVGAPKEILGVIGRAVTAIVLVVAGAVIVSPVAMYKIGATRSHEWKAAGWTKSKKSGDADISAPPKPPAWAIGFLAADPRVVGPGALVAAHGTLHDLIPAGDVVETVAASPTLARLYERAGFQRWHASSLAMWRVY